MQPESQRFAIDASVPTSRAAFRVLAKSVGTTNRQADMLRSSLLAAWAAGDGTYELECRLRDLQSSQSDGTHRVETLLAVWFSFAELEEDTVVRSDAPVLDGLPDDVRETLSTMIP